MQLARGTGRLVRLAGLVSRSTGSSSAVRFLSSSSAALESSASSSRDAHSRYKYPQFFSEGSVEASLSTIPGGNYVDLDIEELDRLFPEGLPNAVVDEFRFSGRRSWMARDVGALLCNLVNEYERTKGVDATKSGGHPAESKAAILDVPGLTDRPEWPTTRIGVRSYGKKLEGAAAVEGDLEDHLKAFKEAKTLPGGKILLTGPRGSGKSTALAQMVMHARRKGWLCLFVPNGWDHMQTGDYVDSLSKNSRTALLGDDEARLFNNVEQSKKLLRSFWTAHSDKLKTFPITLKDRVALYDEPLASLKESWQRAMMTVYDKKDQSSFLSKRRKFEGEDNMPWEDEADELALKNFDWDNFKLKTLEDLVLLGVAFRDLSGLAVTILVEELRLLDKQGVPVMLAVDEYNSWFNSSAFSVNSEPVKGDEICVPRALRFLSKVKAETDGWSLKNGLCVAAITHKHPDSHFVTFKDTIRSTPLLIDVPAYSQKEFLAAMQFYTHQVCIDADVTTQRILAYRTFTASIPRDLRISAGAFFNSDALSGVKGEMAYDDQPGNAPKYDATSDLTSSSKGKIADNFSKGY